eukprot:1580977-Rhodomonas_salina.1
MRAHCFERLSPLSCRLAGLRPPNLPPTGARLSRHVLFCICQVTSRPLAGSRGLSATGHVTELRHVTHALVTSRTAKVTSRTWNDSSGRYSHSSSSSS